MPIELFFVSFSSSTDENMNNLKQHVVHNFREKAASAGPVVSAELNLLSPTQMFGR